MTRTHDPHTPVGRAGLRRVVNYERKRFGMVRASVADRILTALEDEHARPANADHLRGPFSALACEIANGDVAGAAISALGLIQMARDERDRRLA